MSMYVYMFMYVCVNMCNWVNVSVRRSVCVHICNNAFKVLMCAQIYMRVCVVPLFSLNECARASINIKSIIYSIMHNKRVPKRN